MIPEGHDRSHTNLIRKLIPQQVKAKLFKITMVIIIIIIYSHSHSLSSVTNFVTIFSDFSDPSSNFITKKRIATNLAKCSGFLETIAKAHIFYHFQRAARVA